MDEEDRRVRVTLTMGPHLYDLLREVQSDLKIKYEDGRIRKYPFSYLVEDILLWVLEDEDRWEKFLHENYTIISDEEFDSYANS